MIFLKEHTTHDSFNPSNRGKKNLKCNTKTFETQKLLYDVMLMLFHYILDE